ncbi:hypothetical protein [Streptomyces misionensis]|uniref:hypothetical protein n=1 Tax=Streptomyces misionensis TaxID=67331 RepID=UPI003F4C4379
MSALSREFEGIVEADALVAIDDEHDLSPYGNGWSFWVLDDGSGEFLQSIRCST